MAGSESHRTEVTPGFILQSQRLEAKGLNREGVDVVLGLLLTSGASDGQQPVGHGFGLDRMLHQFGDNGLAQL